MASITTNAGRLKLLNGANDFLTDTLKVVLLGSGYTPDKDHEFISDLTPGSNEVSGTGYTGGFGGSGRKTLASKAVTKNNTTDLVTLGAANLTWTAATIGTVAYAVICKEGTSDADSPIFFVCAITANGLTNGGDWTLPLASIATAA